MNNKEKFAANIQRMNDLLNNANNVNWNAKYYREKNAQFYTSSSYSAPSEPVVQKLKKREFAQALKKAQKVRHNPTQAAPKSAVVMINGIPHKRTNGGYKALVPIAESKKWELA